MRPQQDLRALHTGWAESAQWESSHRRGRSPRAAAEEEGKTLVVSRRMRCKKSGRIMDYLHARLGRLSGWKWQEPTEDDKEEVCVTGFESNVIITPRTISSRIGICPLTLPPQTGPSLFQILPAPVSPQEPQQRYWLHPLKANKQVLKTPGDR